MRFFLGFIVCVVVCSGNVLADKPTCRMNNNGVSYCKYIGKIESLYINSENTIMVYFDERLNIQDAKNVGFDVVSEKAAALFRHDGNILFSDRLYEALLEAVGSDLSVVIHMRSVENGYLIIDRMWLK